MKVSQDGSSATSVLLVDDMAYWNVNRNINK